MTDGRWYCIKKLLGGYLLEEGSNKPLLFSTPQKGLDWINRRCGGSPALTIREWKRKAYTRL